MFTHVDEKVKKAEMSIVVIRKDGSREDLGVVARYDAAMPPELTEDKPSLARRVLSVLRF